LIIFDSCNRAISVALGPLAIGAFTNNDALWQAIDNAGRKTAERMWRMPLFPAYKEQMKSGYSTSLSPLTFSLYNNL